MEYNKLSSSEQYVVDCLINELHFDKVLTAMQSIGWTYHGKKTIDINELINTAKNLLANCILLFNKNLEFQQISTGGFTALILDCATTDDWYKHIELRFSIEDINIEYTKFSEAIYKRSKKLDYINSVEYQKLLLD